MGCGASKSYEGKPFITETASALELARIHEGIKKDDLFIFNRCQGLSKLSENLGEPGDTLTCLHLAARYDSYTVLGYILKHLKDTYPAKFPSFVSIQDKQKHTPVMLAVKKDYVLSFSILFQHNACDFTLKDEAGKTLMEYINQSVDCKEYFQIHSKTKSIAKGPEVARPEYRQQKSRSSRFIQPAEISSDTTLARIRTKSPAYEIYKTCLESKVPFVDKSFPANAESLTLGKADSNYEEYSKAVWRRPPEFLGVEYDKIKVFYSVDPCAIFQGKLGASYFLSCLSSMAEFPTRIIENFIIRDVNKFGVYCVRFYSCGVPTEIVIDDLFPCQAADPTQPLFSRAKDNELWVMILEKAWAKHFKHYTSLESWASMWAFQNLTNAPAFTYETADYDTDDLFEVLEEADKRNWMCSCICAPQDNGVGLQNKQSYALIAAYDFNGKRLLKLRNPWGRFEFKGDYSDNSDKWTDSLKRQVGFVQAEDGMFFMSIDDFKKNFSTFTICFYHDNWYYEYDTISSKPNHATYHEFEVKDPTTAYFRVHQPDERSKKETDPNYRVSPVEISVCMIKIDGSLRDIVDNHCDKDSELRDFGINSLLKQNKGFQLTPGKYLVRSKVQWRSGNEESYTVSVYSSKKISLRIPEEKPADYHKRRNMTIAAKNSKKKILKEGVSFTEGWGDNNIYYFYINNLGSKVYEMEWTLKNSNDFKLKKNKNNVSDVQVKLKLEPGQSDIIIVKKLEILSKVEVDFDWTDSLI